MMGFYCMAFMLFNSFMVPYAAQYGIEGIGTFFTVYALVLLFSRPLSGRLLDRFGASKIFYPCTALFILSYVLVGTVHKLPVLLLAAAIAGASWGSLQPSMQAMAMQSVPPQKRGVASNTCYWGMDLGYFVGPTLGGIVAAKTGSYGTMYLCAIVPILIGFVIFLTTWKRFRRRLAALQQEEQSRQ